MRRSGILPDSDGGHLARRSALLISICVVLTGCGHGPGPDDIIRNAYAWYVRELKSGVNPLEQRRSELQQFVTEGFLTSLDNMRAELEASQFMDAQSFDAKLSIEKITEDSRAATVRIGLSGHMSGHHVLNVYLVKVEGSWKIDDVKVIEEFSFAEKTKRLAAVKAPYSNLLPPG
jgi:Protein of unknown function (DUF3828)